MSETMSRATIDALVNAIFSMRDGEIAREVACWSKPFPAPEWRASWLERM